MRQPAGICQPGWRPDHPLSCDARRHRTRSEWTTKIPHWLAQLKPYFLGVSVIIPAAVSVERVAFVPLRGKPDDTVRFALYADRHYVGGRITASNPWPTPFGTATPCLAHMQLEDGRDQLVAAEPVDVPRG
jgi:hypothetical protein